MYLYLRFAFTSTLYADQVSGFSVEYGTDTIDGRTYDPLLDRTYFTYEVCVVQGIPGRGFSHITFEIPVCEDNLIVTSCSPTGCEFGYDPPTQLYGVKWEDNIQEGQCKTYQYGFNGNIAEGLTTVRIKAGNCRGANCPELDIEGPACTSDPDPTPTPTPSPTPTPTPDPTPPPGGEECGNGIVEGGEQCDDGNLIDGDGCSSQCTLEYCGDGVIHTDFGELCDDGNTTDGDGCSSDCKNELCGDGILSPELNEQCDDGNTQSGDGCDSNCQIENPEFFPENCDTYDITESQFEMDAGVKDQEYLINRALRIYKKLSSGQKAKKYANKTATIANETQLAAWRLSWSVPSSGKVCEFNEALCVSSNINQVMVAEYTVNTRALHRIMKKVLRKIGKVEGRTKKIVKRLKKKERNILKNNLARAASIPGTVTACIFPEF